MDEGQLFEEHRKWAARASPDAGRPDHANPPEPERRLKIGYVSGDFRTHSCAYFLAPLFANHDRSAVECFAYSSVERAAETTARLRGLIVHWRHIDGPSDVEAADMVSAAVIGFLVVLAGYLRGRRLCVLPLPLLPVSR